MVRTKNQESSRCWDWVWIEALSYWMTLRTVSWPPCASAIQQYHWGKGGTSLNTRCTAQAFQAKLQNSKISMLIRKHFLNDSPVPFDFFLKGWEWPGSQWGTRTISVALAGWAPLYLQNIRAGLPKIPTALKKKTMPVLARQKGHAETPVCLMSTAVHRLLQKFPWCTGQTAAKLSMSGWEGRERQQNAARFTSVEDKHLSLTFS